MVAWVAMEADLISQLVPAEVHLVQILSQEALTPAARAIIILFKAPATGSTEAQVAVAVV
jgi:hypothetical protein